jgi:PAS domain S-box-containing protein
MTDPEGLPQSQRDVLATTPPSEQEIADLRRSAAVLRAFCEALPPFMLTVDLDLTVLTINRTLPELPPETVLGVSALTFVAPAYHAAARQCYAEAVRTQKPSKYDSIASGPDGGQAWYTSYVSPIIEDGRMTGFAVAVEDITAHKMALEAARLAADKLANYARELEEKNRLLAVENAERERTEAALRALSTPIIQAWEGVLALPIIGSVDGQRAAQMMEMLLGEIVRTRARFAVLDLTGVETVDTATVANLLRIVRAAGLLGSRCLVSGIAPAVAQTMVTAGGSAEGLQTFGKLQDALRYALFKEGVQALGAKRA